MLQPVGELKPGDVVLSDSSVSWSLIRLATPTRPAWHVGPLAGQKGYSGPFLYWPTQQDWVGNGIAELVDEDDLGPLRHHLTKRMWLFGTRAGLAFRCMVWNERNTLPGRVTVDRFAWHRKKTAA